MSFTRLTLADLINIKRRDTNVKANVVVGDLVEIVIDEEKTIGIVADVDERAMKLQTPNGEVKWVSLYVKYTKL